MWSSPHSALASAVLTLHVAVLLAGACAPPARTHAGAVLQLSRGLGLTTTFGAGLVSRPFAGGSKLSIFVIEFSQRYMAQQGTRAGLMVCVQRAVLDAALKTQSTRRGSACCSQPHIELVPELMHRHGPLPVLLACPGQSSIEAIASNHAVNVIVVGTAAFAREKVELIRPAGRRPTTGLHLLVVMVAAAGDDEGSLNGTMAALMAALWARAFSKVVVAVAYDEAVSLYAMDPFANSTGRCGFGGVRAVSLGRIRARDLDIGRMPPLSGRPFASVVPRDLRGCSIIADVYVSPSARPCRGSPDDWSLSMDLTDNILELVARRRNFLPVRRRITGDDILPYNLSSGSMTTGLLRIQADDADTSLGLYFLTPDRVRAVRPSHTINQLWMGVYLRCRAGLVTDGQGHLGALAHRLWRSGLAGLLVAAAVVTVVAQAALVRCGSRGAVREVPHGDGWVPAFSKATLRAWAVLCEVSVPRLSGTSPAVMAAARFVAGAWLLLTLNVNVALKGLLTAETSHVRPPPIRSLEELLRLAPDTVFGYSSPVMKPAVQDAGIYNVFLCEDSACEDRFNNDSNRNFAMLQTNYMQSHLKCPRGCHYMLRDKIFSFFTVMYSRKALGDLFDTTIQRLHSSGLISAWLRRDRRRRARRPPERRTGTTTAPRDAFLVLAAGLAAAGVAFAVEWARPEVPEAPPHPQPRGQGRRTSVRLLSGYGYTLYYR